MNPTTLVVSEMPLTTNVSPVSRKENRMAKESGTKIFSVFYPTGIEYHQISSTGKDEIVAFLCLE